ncbi:MAG: M23 family metallopeptidase [Syntrophotaleaceae bacterium]
MLFTKAGRKRFFPTGMLLAFLLFSCAPPRGVYHRVERGQTFYRICKTYQVDEDVVARINRLRDRSSLEVGQRLFIPGATRTRGVPATVGSRGNSAAPDIIQKTPAPASTKTKSKSAETARPKSLPADLRGKFSWPVRGAIVRPFGQTNGSVSKGVEIAVPNGTGVRAAAAGKVTYSGNGISGYGNLIILKHDEAYFTVYGFNERALVKTGEYVSKEQRIALSGTPPGGGNPRIHFEIRRGKEALDPLFFLP